MNGVPRAGALALAIMAAYAPVAMAVAFPDVPGLVKQGDPRSYDPDNLFEYIDGDAFNYINYGFELVEVQDYFKEGKLALTVDIYRHSTDNNGFGIYSHERPADAEPLALGAQGYYRNGLLNFFKGRYYVKLRATEPSGGTESLLKKVAAQLADGLQGRNSIPATARAFPKEGMIPNSLRYMGGSFLGHGFLHSAFVADYRQGDGKLQLFIIEAPDEAGSGKMLDDYLALVKRKEGTHSLEDGVYRFKDPYLGSRGYMNIRKSGRYLYGLFCDDAAVAASYLKAVDKGLR